MEEESRKAEKRSKPTSHESFDMEKTRNPKKLHDTHDTVIFIISLSLETDCH